MLDALQYYISSFVLLTCASAFGLALTIGIAGITRADLPFNCKDCVLQVRA